MALGIEEVLNDHMPAFYGGGMVELVSDKEVSWKSAPERYEAGSPNYPGVVGLGKAIEILQEVGFEAIQAHEQKLIHRLIDGLKKLPNVVLYGDCENVDDRVGVVSFNFSDINSMMLATRLAQVGAATRRGAFCAHPYVWRLLGVADEDVVTFEGCIDAKTPGMIRASFGIYNTEAEVDEFLEMLQKAMEHVKNNLTDEDEDIPQEY